MLEDHLGTRQLALASHLFALKRGVDSISQ